MEFRCFSGPDGERVFPLFVANPRTARLCRSRVAVVSRRKPHFLPENGVVLLIPAAVPAGYGQTGGGDNFAQLRSWIYVAEESQGGDGRDDR